MTEYLHAGANCEHNCTLVDGTMQRTALFKFTGGLNLRPILAAAHEIEIAGVGHGSTGIDSDVLDRNAAPLETTGEHKCISTVSVGSKQIRVERNDPHGRVAMARRVHRHRTPPTRSR